MISSSLLEPAKNLLFESIPILLGSMIAFLAFVWSAKKLLDFLNFGDYKIAQEVKRDIHREHIKNEVLKSIKQKDRDKTQKYIKKQQQKQQVKKDLEDYKKNAKIEKKNAKIEKKKEILKRINLFKAKKLAIDMRQNELIKEARIADMHSKINNRRMKQDFDDWTVFPDKYMTKRDKYLYYQK